MMLSGIADVLDTWAVETSMRALCIGPNDWRNYNHLCLLYQSVAVFGGCGDAGADSTHLLVAAGVNVFVVVFCLYFVSLGGCCCRCGGLCRGDRVAHVGEVLSCMSGDADIWAAVDCVMRKHWECWSSCHNNAGKVHLAVHWVFWKLNITQYKNHKIEVKKVGKKTP